MNRRVWRLFLIFGALAGVPGLPVPSFAQNHAAEGAQVGNSKIAGTIVAAADGQPIAGAEVSILPAGTNRILQRFVTGTDGYFVFGNIKPGKYLLMSAKNGYPQQPYQGHGQYSTAVAVGNGLVAEGLVFGLRRGASITGTLVDDQNEPIRDAEVRLFQSAPETGVPLNVFVAQASPDDRGQYRFSRLPPGKYFVAVSARPWYASTGTLPARTRTALDKAFPVTYYGGSTEANAATPIALKDGDRATADIGLFAVPSLRLRVRTRETGGTNVQVRQPVFSTFLNPPLETSQTKDVVEIRGLAPGRYQVDFQTGRDAPVEHSRNLDLAGDTEIDALDAPALSQIRGVVAPHAMERVSGGSIVRLSNMQSGLQFDARISRKNEFHFEASVPPGLYSISIVGPANAAVGAISATGAIVIGHAVEIRGNTPVRLTITVERSLQITGLAQRAGKPVSGAMIILVPNDPRHNLVLFRRDQSDSDGTFSLFNVLPGEYMLLALENAWDIEWANPSVLAKYLKAGKVLQVGANGGGARVAVDVQ